MRPRQDGEQRALVHSKSAITRSPQVVTNLLSNAMKFAPGKPVEVEIRAEGGLARLMVTDRGIGITARQSQVLQRLSRVTRSRRA